MGESSDDVHDESSALDRAENTAGTSLLSDQPTIELVALARAGNREAMTALLERCLPPLKRWAHGRLPAGARGNLDTADLVQEAALHALSKLDTFEPKHVYSMQAYLRKSVINRVCDEVRKVQRRPATSELSEEHPSDWTSPLEAAIQTEAYDRYREALTSLTRRDRAMIIARIEMQWSLAEIAERFEMHTTDAARMAVVRAVRRLSGVLAHDQ